MDKFTIGGVEFFLSKQEVERKLNGIEAEPVHEMYVEVGGNRYPIKQALMVATGLLRGGFTTHDAMRVFRKLGLKIGSERIDPKTMPERCYTMLKSVSEFDRMEVAVVRGMLAQTDRDKCFIANYIRAKANAEALLLLKNAKYVQAIAMMARSLFELAVDVKLINFIPDAVKKMLAFSDVEKLRAAKKIVKFKTNNPAAAVDASIVSIHQAFITSETNRIDAERAAIWPGVKKLSHWSEKTLADRAALLKAPFDEIYEVEYAKVSWFVHSGLTGFVNLQAETFNMIAGEQNKLAAQCYGMVLTSIIDEFGLERANPEIKNNLRKAMALPFTTSPEEARDVMSGNLV